MHPSVVHFPIALLIVSVALDAAGVLLRRAGMTQAGFACLVLGSLGAAAAVLTGPEEDAKDAAARMLLQWHELFAALAVLCCLIMVGMRLGNADGLRGPGVYGFLALGVVLIGCVIATGYFGGQMVYERGVGVAPVQTAPAPVAGNTIFAMWAKLGGVALVVVILGYTLARFRTLRTPSPRRWTLARDRED